MTVGELISRLALAEHHQDVLIAVNPNNYCAYAIGDIHHADDGSVYLIEGRFEGYLPEGLLQAM